MKKHKRSRNKHTGVTKEMVLNNLIDRAARLINNADGIIIGAGAGMGVDSGLPDFRGDTGFWKAYPVYANLGLKFMQIANPDWFDKDPTMAWGFYGHRFNLYKETTPHAGFNILKNWGESKEFGCVVATSNVDGHFQKAGFNPAIVEEIHGTINWLQCLDKCGVGIFAPDFERVEIDPATARATGTLPTCPNCGGLARPNILMFGDGEWDESRSADQADVVNKTLVQMLNKAPKIVVVELGAGTAISSIRRTSEGYLRLKDITLVRINPREFDVPKKQVGIPTGALEGLKLIDSQLKKVS